MFLIEIGLVLVAVLMGLLYPSVGSRCFEKLEQHLARFSHRRTLAVISVGLIALGVRAALLPVEPIPQPIMTDEFSYLLMADTFAHGRVTNPAHPMWVHFETFHVNQQPTYSSMYYPSQGMFLAFGQLVFGHPFWGVWLSTGLMCAAFCWALQGWMPPTWALLGGILAVIRLGAFSYWANSYWGGAVAAIGGALVLGAFPRIKRSGRVCDALIMALGLAILGNSRPYESIFYSIPILGALAWFIFRSGRLATYVRRVLLPLGVVLLITFFAMGYYFWRCTGSPFRTPYVVNLQTYEVAPLFPWQELRPSPTYHHPVMEKFFSGFPIQQYNEARHHPARHLAVRFLEGGLFFVGPALILPWLLLVGILPYGMSFRQLGRKTGLLLATCFLGFVGLSLPVYFQPHYAAPICCAFYALELQALRRIRFWDVRGKQRGTSVVRYLVAACVLLLVIRAAEWGLHPTRSPEFVQTWYGEVTGTFPRSTVLDTLARQPGQHLIIARYDADHDPNLEWVYNRAYIDGSEVVWARDMGESRNLELIRYFKDRKVWLLEPDVVPPKLSAYPTIQDAAGLDTDKQRSSSDEPEVR